MERMVMTVEWWLSRVCIKGCEHIRRTATAAGTCIGKQGSLENSGYWFSCEGSMLVARMISLNLVFMSRAAKLSSCSLKIFLGQYSHKKSSLSVTAIFSFIPPCGPHGGTHMKEKMNRQAYQLPMTNKHCGEKGRDRYC